MACNWIAAFIVLDVVDHRLHHFALETAVDDPLRQNMGALISPAELGDETVPHVTLFVSARCAMLMSPVDKFFIGTAFERALLQTCVADAEKPAAAAVQRVELTVSEFLHILGRQVASSVEANLVHHTAEVEGGLPCHNSYEVLGCAAWRALGAQFTDVAMDYLRLARQITSPTSDSSLHMDSLLRPALLYFFVSLASVGVGGEAVSYGVRWKQIVDEVADYDLPCERLGTAAGLKVADFDRVFPWSEIKRCKVIPQSDGPARVIHEGEPGFDDVKVAGHLMVEFPKHYSRREVRDGMESRWVSKSKLPGFYVDPVFIEKGKELEHVYVGAYEAFIGEDGRMMSVSGVHPTPDLTRVEYRRHARENGRGFGTFDLRTLLMLQNLFVIEHADRNSQRAVGNGFGKVLQPVRTYPCVRPERGSNRFIAAMTKGMTLKTIENGVFVGGSVLATSHQSVKDVILGSRVLKAIKFNDADPGLVSFYLDGRPFDTTTDMCLGGSPQMTGLSDAIAGHTGHGEFHGSPPYDSYRCAVKYRYMENLWGNLWCFVDGVNLAGGIAYVSDDFSGYESGVTSGSYVAAGISSVLQNDNGDIGGPREIHFLKNLGWNPEKPWLALPQDCTYEKLAALPDQSLRLRSGHFGDYYYLNAQASCYVHGGGFDHYWRCGLFTLRGWSSDSQRWYLYGSRLVYKPLP